jgi:hypothetical protein
VQVADEESVFDEVVGTLPAEAELLHECGGFAAVGTALGPDIGLGNDGCRPEGVSAKPSRR